MFPSTNSRSAQLFERARKVLVGGNTRYAVFMTPYQLYAANGSGSRVIDVDGVERIDFQNNMTVLIHGHAHPVIVARVKEQIERGTCFGLSTESEIALAEILCDRVPSIETVRFVNSGTEAVMTAIKAARAYTGRSKIAKVEGSYHGSYDYAEVSLDSTPGNWGKAELPNRVPYAEGTPRSVLDDMIVIPFNDTKVALDILRTHKDELAAVLIDPLPGRFGLIPATREFLEALREFTQRHGMLLVFDEVICFRLGYRGAQGEFECEPDLTALGKVIGGGFPIGAVAGKRDVMAVFDLSRGRPPILQGGTFNGNPVSMEAGLASMELLTPEAFQRLNSLGELARSNLTAAFHSADVPGQVTGMGSLFRIHPTNRVVKDYRSAYQLPEERAFMEALWRYLLNNRILISKVGMGAISTVNTKAEVERLAEMVYEGIRALKSEAARATAGA